MDVDDAPPPPYRGHRKRVRTLKGIYEAGPCSVLVAAGEVDNDGWHDIILDDLLALRWFARSVPEVAAVQSVVLNALFAGPLVVTYGKSAKKRKTSDDDDDDEDDQESVQRSAMWTPFTSDTKRTIDEWGWAPVTWSVNNTYGAIKKTDPKQPQLLNIGRVGKISHKLSIRGEHSWRFYERVPANTEGCELPGFRLFTDVFVVGTSLPDHNGNICSMMRQIMETAYSVYIDKVNNTKLADKERARPTIVMQEGGGDASGNKPLNRYGPDAVTAGEAEHRIRQTIEAGIKVREATCGDPNATAASASNEPPNLMSLINQLTGEAEKQHKMNAATTTVVKNTVSFDQFSLPSGRAIASNHLAESPGDTAVFYQVFLNLVCLRHSVPPALITSADATGTAKLNADTASPETARIFRQSLAKLRRDLTYDIANIASWMYADEREKQALDHTTTTFKKTGKTPDQSELDALTRVSVQMPAEPDRLLFIQMVKDGWIEYGKAVPSLAGFVNASPELFLRRPLIDLKDLAGVKPPDEGAAAAKPKKKKAKK